MKLNPTSIILIAGALISYLRLFWGLDTSDESQYIAQTLLPLTGGQPFLSDLLIQQSAQLLITPLCWLYSLFFGFTGVVLFIKNLYWLVALTSLIVWHRELKKTRGGIETTLLVLTFILFTPCSLPAWSYNTIAQLLLPLSVLLFQRSLYSEGTKREAMVAGGLSAITCFCYPTTVVVYLLLGISVISNSSLNRSRTIPFLISSIVLSSILGISLLLEAGIPNILHALAFSAQFGEIGGYDKLCWMARQIIINITGWQATFIAILLVMTAFDRKMQCLKSWLITLSILCCLLSVNKFTDYQLHGWIFNLTIILAILRVYLRNNGLLATLPPYLESTANFCLLSGIMYGYSSGNGTINCPVGFMPALCIYLIQLLNTVKSVGHSERFVKYWSLAFAGCIALYFCYSPFAFIYRDAPTWSTAQLVNVGPFKGIYSTPDKVALLTFLQEDLTELAKTKKTIFASYMAPAYFITKMTPVTRMLNIHPVYWPPERVDEILEQSIKLKEFPEVVVTGKFGPQFTYQFENYFLATGKYSVAYQRPWYQILVKNKD